MYKRNNEGVNQRRKPAAKIGFLSQAQHPASPNTTPTLPLRRHYQHHSSKRCRRKRGCIKNLKMVWGGLLSFEIKKQKWVLAFGLWCSVMIFHSAFRGRAVIHVHPIVLGCHFSPHTNEIIKIKHLPIYEEDRYPIKRQVDWTIENEEFENNLRNSNKYDSAKAEKVESNQCKLPHDWETKSYPTCNSMHENDLTKFFAVGDTRVEERLVLHDHGFFRDIWQVKGGMGDKIVILKTLRHIHELTDRHFERHRRDALVMEQLTSSTHVAQIYGHCGNSIFSEYATAGTVSDIIWPIDGSNCTLSSIERLELALKIAQAVSDAHLYDSSGKAALAHTDIAPSQFLVFDDGSVKINDFNRCRFLTRDENGEACPYKVTHNPGKFRSPEEYSYTDQSEKVDIYSMGNVLYSLLTELWPFELVEDVAKVQEDIKNGERPFVKDFSDDQISSALLEVINLCWKQNADERPSAKNIASILEEKASLFK